MNSKDKKQIIGYASYLLRCYKEKNTKPNDSWHNLESKQTLYNALQGLKVFGLIQDFSLTRLTVTIDGKEHENMKCESNLVFKRTGKPI
jgi:hypothetical protein